jgi:hypothetical protein
MRSAYGRQAGDTVGHSQINYHVPSIQRAHTVRDEMNPVGAFVRYDRFDPGLQLLGSESNRSGKVLVSMKGPKTMSFKVGLDALEILEAILEFIFRQRQLLFQHLVQDVESGYAVYQDDWVLLIDWHLQSPLSNAAMERFTL